MKVINSPADLDQHVLQSKFALLDIWAPWCGPCNALMPVIEALASTNPDLVLAKANVDEQKPLAQQLGVRSIPALFLFKNGELVSSLVGAQANASRVQAWIDSHR